MGTKPPWLRHDGGRLVAALAIEASRAAGGRRLGLPGAGHVTAGPRSRPVATVISPGRRWTVEVRVGERLAAGGFTGRLVLTTSADVPEVVVPVSGERPRP